MISLALLTTAGKHSNQALKEGEMESLYIYKGHPFGESTPNPLGKCVCVSFLIPVTASIFSVFCM
jgi:hypothetical protein